MEKLTVAAVQMTCILGDVGKNLRLAKELISVAHRQGAKLVVLPELFNSGYSVDEYDIAFAESIPGQTTDYLCTIAAENDMYLVAGLIEKGELAGTVYNTAILVSPKGKVAKYRKINLWDKEKIRFMSGNELPIWDMPGVRLGPQICYDIGFPEGARTLTLQGAMILVYPSAFGKTRSYAWDIATRARALENGVYLIAANRSGIDKEVTFNGCSRIVGPQGNVITETFDDDGVIVADIDLAQIAVQRRNIPYLKDLRYSTALK